MPLSLLECMKDPKTAGLKLWKRVTYQTYILFHLNMTSNKKELITSYNISKEPSPRFIRDYIFAFSFAAEHHLYINSERI